MKHILDFYRYNSDVRKKYLELMEKLPWEEVVKDRGTSFSSIRNVFLHVLNAYRFWFQYGIRDNLKEYRGLDPENFRNIDDIRKQEQDMNTLVMSLVESLREEDLSKTYVIHTRHRVLERTMESLLIHMIEEELQHRGEINCMLWQQDIDPPVTSFDDWLEQKSASKDS
jgi:uncharacterized damage-inducible protein DinB